MAEVEAAPEEGGEQVLLAGRVALLVVEYGGEGQQAGHARPLGLHGRLEDSEEKKRFKQHFVKNKPDNGP